MEGTKQESFNSEIFLQILGNQIISLEILSKQTDEAFSQIQEIFQTVSTISSPNEKKKKCKQILLEACSSCINNKLPSDKFVLLLSKMVSIIPEIPFLLVDILWFLGIKTSEKSFSKFRINLVSFIKEILRASICKEEILKERLDLDLLGELKLLDEKQFNNKMKKENTKTSFTQQKYNLLREESEGYSKLLLELNRGEVSLDNIEDLCDRVMALIGFFDLDPNRVFDIILDSYEENVDNDFFLKLIRIFNSKYLPHILGFKFQFYSQKKELVPEKLFLLSARLIKEKFFSWQDLFVHLTPEDSEIFAEYESKLKSSSKAVQHIGIVNIGDKEKKKEELIEDPYSKKDNQKFGLIVGLLSIDDWNSADELLRHLSKINPSQNYYICEGLCQKLTNIIQPYYQPFSCQSMISNPNFDISNPKIDTVDPVIPENLCFSTVFPILNHLNLFLYRDPVLLVKCIRLLRESLRQTEISEDMKLEIQKIIAKVFLPCLTMLPANPGLSNTLWDLIKLFPYTVRYYFYGLWKNKYYDRYPELMKAKVTSASETKKIMRRLTKDNYKQLGRQLGKLSHNNPSIVWDQILDQIQQFDSLIQPVVDALKYVTHLSLDVLSFIIVENLADPNKAKLKNDGSNISSWLQYLAIFCGTLYKKYPHIEINGVIQYVVNRLKDGSSLDLIVLRELISKMTGIEITEDLSEDQLEALAGGETLKQVSSPFSQLARNLKRPIEKLRSALLSSKVLVPLLLLITQARSQIIFHAETGILKVIGELYDKCQESLLQYVDFIDTYIPPSELVHLLPSILTLFSQYHLEPETAFFISRPILSLRYRDISVTSLIHNDRNENDSSLHEENKESLVDTVYKLFPSSLFQSFSPSFYVTFWSLTLYDIYVPRKRYEDEIKKLQSQLDQDEKDTQQNSKKKKEKEKIQASIEKLKNELIQQEENHKRVLEALEKEKNWLINCPSRNEIAMHLLQYCVFPRCIYSTSDALYCSKFVHLLHKLGTPCFSTLQYYDKVLRDVTLSLFCCTENEASRLGRFLNETLSLLAHWKSDPNIYEKECIQDLPGFSISFVNPQSKKATYSEFLKVNFKWHCKMTKSFANFLESKEYTEVRNALIVLTKIINVFPVMKRVALLLEKRVVKLKDDPKNNSLKILATRYHTLLEQQKKNCVSDEEFQKNPQDQNEKKPSSELNNGTSTINENTEIHSKEEKSTKNNNNIEESLKRKKPDSTVIHEEERTTKKRKPEPIDRKEEQKEKEQKEKEQKEKEQKEKELKEKREREQKEKEQKEREQKEKEERERLEKEQKEKERLEKEKQKEREESKKRERSSGKETPVKDPKKRRVEESPKREGTSHHTKPQRERTEQKEKERAEQKEKERAEQKEKEKQREKEQKEKEQKEQKEKEQKEKEQREKEQREREQREQRQNEKEKEKKERNKSSNISGPIHPPFPNMIYYNRNAASNDRRGNTFKRDTKK